TAAILISGVRTVDHGLPTGCPVRPSRRKELAPCPLMRKERPQKATYPNHADVKAPNGDTNDVQCRGLAGTVPLKSRSVPDEAETYDLRPYPVPVDTIPSNPQLNNPKWGSHHRTV